MTDTPKCKIAGVKLNSAYVKAHASAERVILKDGTWEELIKRGEAMSTGRSAFVLITKDERVENTWLKGMVVGIIWHLESSDTLPTFLHPTNGAGDARDLIDWLPAKECLL